jgi:hypothetical protein
VCLSLIKSTKFAKYFSLFADGLYRAFKICKIWVCRCALQTPPLFYLLHSGCTHKFHLILLFFYDLVSRDVTLSTVIFLERKYGKNHTIEADLEKLHIIVHLQIIIYLFSIPFPCALGYRTLCSTSRRINLCFPFSILCLLPSLPVHLSPPCSG